MATRRRPSKFDSTIDKRIELAPSERGNCSEMTHEEIVWEHIHRNALAAKKRGHTKKGKTISPDKKYWMHEEYLKRRDGASDERRGEEEAKAKKSEREQVSGFPQVKRNKPYKRPKRKMK